MRRTTTYFAKRADQKEAEPTAIEVEALGQGRYAVTLDGHRYDLDSLVLPHGAVSILVENNSYNVDFEEKGDVVTVLLRSAMARFDIADERRLRLRAAATAFQVEGTQVVTAPMPGKIVKVMVAVGEAVKEGQGLVVVEAMKMENELKAPKAGTVVKVLATEGSAVENGASLVVIE